MRFFVKATDNCSKKKTRVTIDQDTRGTHGLASLLHTPSEIARIVVAVLVAEEVSPEFLAGSPPRLVLL